MQLVHVADKESVQNIWNVLKEAFRPSSTGSLIVLMRKLYRTVMTEHKSVKEHLNILTGYFKE